MKKIIPILLLFFTFNLSFSLDAKQKFIKGNIQDKISAIKECTESDKLWLSNKAIDFVLENSKYLNEDRDLETLAVTAILSLPNDYGNLKLDKEKSEIADKFIFLYDSFSYSKTVQISIISKYLSLSKYLPTEPLKQRLNTYLSSPGSITADPSLLKTIIVALGDIGDNESFKILYNLQDSKYKQHIDEINNSLTNLIPVSMNEVFILIQSKDINHLSRISLLIDKKTKIPQNFISEIAENLLNESIVIVGNTTTTKEQLIEIQMKALKILYDNKCTRASKTVISYFDVAKNEFEQNLLTEDQFIFVIKSLAVIAPIDSVNTLINYLMYLNSKVGNLTNVQVNVVIAVINTLGAIGDKTAIDSLLDVTYLTYPESVLSAAQNALLELKW